MNKPRAKIQNQGHFIIQTPDGDEWWLTRQQILGLKKTEMGHTIAKFVIDGRVRIGRIRDDSLLEKTI